MYNERSRSRSPVTRARVSFHQLSALVTYLEGQPLLAKGHIGSSTEGRREARLGWQAAAKMVNGIDDGVHKSASQWSQYWSSYKNKFKVKLRTRMSAAGAGDGKVRLSPLEQRVQALLGPAFISARPGLRVEVDPDISDFAVDGVDGLNTEDGASSISNISIEEPSYATVNVIAANDSYDGNSDECRTFDTKPPASLLRTRVSKASRPPAAAQSRFRQSNVVNQTKLEGLRSSRAYEKAIHKLTLQHMEEKRKEEKEIFELKKKKLLLEISSLENKLINSF